MATAMLSAFVGKKVRRDLAMTGEITLRGNVLPVGGIKEKVLAARRAKIRRVVIPAANSRNLEDIPASLRKDLEFLPVESVEQVFAHALVGFEAGSGKRPPRRPSGTSRPRNRRRPAQPGA